MTEKTAILPRLLRPTQAHTYLSISRTFFDANVRPHIREVKIGTRGVTFDRLDLQINKARRVSSTCIFSREISCLACRRPKAREMRVALYLLRSSNFGKSKNIPAIDLNYSNLTNGYSTFTISELNLHFASNKMISEAI